MAHARGRRHALALLVLLAAAGCALASAARNDDGGGKDAPQREREPRREKGKGEGEAAVGRSPPQAAHRRGRRHPPPRAAPPPPANGPRVRTPPPGRSPPDGGRTRLPPPSGGRTRAPPSATLSPPSVAKPPSSSASSPPTAGQSLPPSPAPAPANSSATLSPPLPPLPAPPSPPGSVTPANDTRERIDLVLFGDSLSDTGNTFRTGGVPQADLYFQGRYTNGPVWHEYLAADVNKKSSETTVLNVTNLAYGGAVACPAYSIVSQYPFIVDLPGQIAIFLNQSAQQAAAPPAAAAGPPRTLLPINFIGSNDVRYILDESLRTGFYPNQSVIDTAITSVTACRIAWARTILAAGDAVWRGQDGPKRKLVFLPVARLDLAPEAPPPIKPPLGALTFALNRALIEAAAALEAELLLAPADSGYKGAKVIVLPEVSEQLLATVNPPFTNSEPCFIQPAVGLEVIPGIVPCTDPGTRPFYDQLHPSTRFHEAIGLNGVLPGLRLAGVLP